MKTKILFLLIITNIIVARHKKDKLLKPMQSKHSYISGKEYYDSLIERASKRNWAVTTNMYYTFEDGGFDCDGCTVPLTNLVFNKDPITFKDIYLFSKLSDDNKVRIKNCLPLAPERGGIPIGSKGQPFGAFRDDLYTTLLAPVQVLIDSDQNEFTALTTAVFHYDFGCDDWWTYELGFTLPFQSRNHDMDVSFDSGDIFRQGFLGDVTQRETTLRQFNNEFTDVIDFFNRGILGSKNLIFDMRQRKTGIGDISFFTGFECRAFFDIQFGFNVTIPTAGKGCGNFVWEPILGHGGAWLFNPYFQLLYITPVPYLNLFGRIAFEISNTFKNHVRAPTLVTNSEQQQVQDVPCLNHPGAFDQYYVSPFECYDTCVPLMADQLVCMNQKFGRKLQMSIGNYAFGIFNTDFRFGVYYDFYHKKQDKFESLCCDDITECCDTIVTVTGSINTCALEDCTDQQAHIISTDLTYKFPNLFELGIGGQFYIAGKNVPRYRSFYLTVAFVF